MCCRLNRGSRILFLSFLFDLYFVLFLFGLCVYVCVCVGGSIIQYMYHIAASFLVLLTFSSSFSEPLLLFFWTFCLDFKKNLKIHLVRKVSTCGKHQLECRFKFD